MTCCTIRTGYGFSRFFLREKPGLRHPAKREAARVDVEMIGQWITLLRLARRRLRSEADYVRFQAYQARLVVDYLVERGIRLRGVRVLDLGCGYGGYSQALADDGAQVVSIDLRPPVTTLPGMAVADALQLPFAADSLPFIFCASLIEHVPEPDRLLAEIHRLLPDGGQAYLSFPPFYSPVGGHEFKPFHLFGERWALRLSRHHAPSYRDCFGDWGLYPLSIRKARKLIATAGLVVEHESTRFAPLNLARLPWVGEFLTWHLQFILVKDSGREELLA
jgi:SAM-dependent methyltransferase